MLKAVILAAMKLLSTAE